MNVISWNIRSFASAVDMDGNAYDVISRVIDKFDVAAIYEVPNTAESTDRCIKLAQKLGGEYDAFFQPSGGLGKENDLVVVIWNDAVVHMEDTTDTRFPDRRSEARQPIYFEVTNKGGNTREMCAWHAPEPYGLASAYIQKTWNLIMQYSVKGPRTAMVMGDFNAQLTVPSSNRKPGCQFTRQINVGKPNGTTLTSGSRGDTDSPNSAYYRTDNTWDQFYTDATLVTVGSSGIYDIIGKLARDEPPFTAAYADQYNTNKKAYKFYLSSVSDHLPVAIDVDFQ